MSGFGFELLATDGAARRGRVTTPHGVVDTPAFMPVGTQGAVKGVTIDQVSALGAEIILGNTYHLHLRPTDDLIARATDDVPPERIPEVTFAKGSYFLLGRRSPFSRLVYPVPEPGGLGIHLTLDLAGRARFGPDVEWVDAYDFNVDAARSSAFYAAIRRYWPALADGDLEPAYAGVRPKIYGPRQAAADFRIDDAARHGVRGVLNLFGIESPGLTASLALASEAVSRIG